MKKKIVFRTRYTPIERAVIAELVAFAEVMAESNENEPDKKIAAFAALLCERAANIVRGDDEPRVFTDQDVLAFAEAWKVEERAKFNPPRKP